MSARLVPMVGQTYRERPPRRRLAGLLTTTWVQRVAPGSPAYVQRDIPSGAVELVCRVGAAPQLSGPLTGPRADVIPPGSTVVGLRFRPGAAAAVLGLPASELTDLRVGAADVWGTAAAAAGERLAAATTGEAAVEVLEELVTAAAARAGVTGPDPLIAEAVRRLMPWHAAEVRDVGTTLHVSERALRRHCLAAIGVGPKTLQRMLRFQGFLARTQSALADGRDPAGGGLARLAADAGYADQAHLTRECVRLTGATPRTFLRDTQEACGCGHDHAASYTPLLAGRFVQERRVRRA
ncbi:DUF6597 domain-containing transcriptional factor [Jiangella alba]|nr:DUF6597 domain-containing transcriptional factor [Jiangella alba]